MSEEPWPPGISLTDAVLRIVRTMIVQSDPQQRALLAKTIDMMAAGPPAGPLKGAVFAVQLLKVIDQACRESTARQELEHADLWSLLAKKPAGSA